MPHCRRRPMTVPPSMLLSLFLLSVIVILLSRDGPVWVTMVHGEEIATTALDGEEEGMAAEESVTADLATLTLEAYTTDQNYRQSFCDRYARLHNDTSYLAMMLATNTAGTATSDTDAAEEDDMTTIANVLSGANLNLIVADDKIHFNYEEGFGINTTVPGLHANILDYMAEEGNFTWRDSFGIMYYENITDPHTFTTYLDWSNERYDMVIDYWAPSLLRYKNGATFTESYINGDMVLIKNQWTEPEAMISWFNWLLPFTPAVWYATLATILISAMIYPWIEYMGGGLENALTIRKWITNRLYKSFINFTGNYAYDPKTPGGCLFGVVFAFWSMLMLASYTANLASLLVVKRIVPPPAINGIQNAIDNSKSMCYPYGTHASDYLKETYPREVTNTEIFIPVPDDADEKYNSLNNGTCDFLIDWRNSYDIVKHQEEYNPDCRLIQEGRTIKPIGFTFASMLDPGLKCTLLVKEVFNYYIRQMHENGKLAELWQAHISSQSNPVGHCDSTYGVNTVREPTEDDDSEDGTAEEEDATRQRRFLKAGGGKSAATAGSVMTELEEEESEGAELSLTIVDMAGTFLLQVMGAVAAILVTILSYLKSKYLRHKKVVQVKRESMRKSQLLEQQHLSITHLEDDTVDDIKYGSRPQKYSNRETTISTKHSSFQSVTSATTHLSPDNSNYHGTDVVHDDDNQCDRQNASTQLPRPPSFKSIKNSDNENKDREREPEYSPRQRDEHPSLDRVQKCLNHLQSSHDELKQQCDGLKYQNDLIIKHLKI